MIMLLTKIDNTVDIISRSLDLAEIKNKNTRILSLSKSLLEIYQLQEEISMLQKEFSKRGINVTRELNVKSYKAKIKQITDSIDSETIPFDRELTELRTGLMKYIDQFTDYWKTMVKEKVKPVINLLTIVKELVRHDNQSIYIINKLNNLSLVQPSTKNFLELDNLINQGTGILLSLNLNEDIIGFLEKVFHSQATVGDLTPEVFSWLQENDLKDSVKLSFF
jgi:hypothetical protein